MHVPGGNSCPRALINTKCLNVDIFTWIRFTHLGTGTFVVGKEEYSE